LALDLVCPGDCDGSGAVTVDELVRGANISIGETPIDDCPSFDVNGDGAVTVDELIAAVNAALFGCPMRMPALVSSDPPTQAQAVPVTAWIRLDFAGPVPTSALQGFRLACDGDDHGLTVSAIAPDTLVANPDGQLPPAASCTLTWPGPDSAVTLPFTTAPSNTSVEVLYDRTNGRLTDPFPDDVWLTADATTPNGTRLAVPIPTGPSDLQGIFKALLPQANLLDGFSPIAHFVIEVADAIDATSVPQTSADSLDPLATVALFDVAAGSAQFGARIPFQLQVRNNDHSVSGATSNTMLIFPSIPLTPGGRYGLLITRRALAEGARPFEPSAFFRAAVAGPVAGEPPVVGQVRSLAAEVLAVAVRAVPPIPVDDIALAVRISIRSTDSIPADLLAIKEQVLAAAPPAYTITSVEPDSVSGSDVAAIVSGTWQSPDWRRGVNLARDAGGRPTETHINSVPFTLALPKAALAGPVPIIMYQHGNPGSAEAEVPTHARQSLAGAGFAVIGFTDNLNREVSAGLTDEVAAVSAQVQAVFFALVQNRKLPDYWVETNAEQIAFLRMIQNLGGLDVLPIGAVDGVPDLNPAAPLQYLGISEGANHAPGFLPYAPEMRAAALVAGGARLAEVLIHQQAEEFLTQLGPLFPSLTPADIWVGLSLFQTIYDVQDPHNHGRFIYRDPLAIAGTTQKASILLVEGLNDTMVPNNATESLAWAIGPIPHLKPVQRRVPFLETVDSPVVANIDEHTTAAFYQYVPVGVPGIPPSPGCVVLPPSIGGEGHFCAQSAAESLQQRVVFFQSTVRDGVPTIIDPLAP
jgi:hypothetical protein